MEYRLKSIELSEYGAVYKRITEDFAPGEYPPYIVLRNQLKKGVQKGVYLLHREKPVAYSICAEGDRYNYVLISLFAVYKENRGKRYGSKFLQEIIKYYTSRDGIIVEVEKPENAVTPQEKAIRERRIQFYEKAGFHLLPGIDYSIWDVPMHLMALSNAIFIDRTKTGKIMYDIY